MPILTITRGLPASGKTTWAREQINAAEPGTLVRINRDDFRAMALHSGYRQPSWECEKVITAMRDAAVETALRAGVSVICDDTNLRVKYARSLLDLAVRCGADWAVKDFDMVSLEECIHRDVLRECHDEPHVGEAVIRDMYNRYLRNAFPVVAPTQTVTPEPYEPPVGAHAAILVDIDGTVALKHEDRDIYDGAKAHMDLPNTAVVEAVEAMKARGHQVIYMSGRSSEHRTITEAWLGRHCPEGMLYMREQGDFRDDAIVKLELFNKFVRHDYNVTCVFDDRDRVVRMWRALGLTVMQVAEGAF